MSSVYAELHCRSFFSFLDGASSPEELIRRAHQLGLSALALTDLNGLYGVVEARQALLDAFDLPKGGEGRAPLKLLYGSEVSFGDDAAVVLVQNRRGWAHLCAALSVGRLAAAKGEFHLTRQELCARAEGTLLLAGGPRSAAMRALCEGHPDKALANLASLRDAWGDRLYVEQVRWLAPGDRERSQQMGRIAQALGLQTVATNDVHHHLPDRKPLHDLLRCIQGGYPLAQAGRRLLPNAEAHLKDAGAMARLFADDLAAVARAREVAERVDFRLCDIRYAYPPPALPPGETADQMLARLCQEGLNQRLGPKAPSYRAQLARELKLIEEMQYAGYFLTMWEVVNVCQHKGVLCQGRGSAANSLVCFALGVTSVRPDVIDMLFERFLSKERNEPPDIDLDIEHERREEILQHVYRQYGRAHAAMVSETIRYRQRSALRDTGKALGLPENQLNRLSKFLSHGWDALDDKAFKAAGVDPNSPVVQRLLALSQALVGFPRHLSIHVGGFILSGEPLSDIVPLENGRMADRTVIQWNKDDVDAMGMFKLDLLGLGMLTVLAKCFALLRQHRGVDLTLQTVPPEDAATYTMLQHADSVGVFQVESRAQMNMLPRLKPTTFYDLVIEVAIVRPGPIQGQMVHPYLRRRRGLEKPDYPHPSMERILGRTLGVPLFQEQVMRLAEAVGEYTAGQADQLRRDMASWRASGRLDRHRDRLMAGMKRHGLSPEFAERVFKQIQGFGAYGFPESHAAAFAHLAYVSAYLKCHHPVEFACALINAQPMGFYSPLVIVNDLKRAGHTALPVDVQESEWDCTVEDRALRLGLRMVRGLGEDAGRAIARARQAGRFETIEALAHRAGLPSRVLVPLAASGALSSLHERREAIWNAAAAAQVPGPLLSGIATAEPPPHLPALQPLEALGLDAHYAGAFAGQHPMGLVRARLSERGILSASALKGMSPEQNVTVAGLVITRQRPGEGRIIYVTLEDETGHTDVAVSEGAFKRFHDVIRLSGALIVRGFLQADGEARNIYAHHVAPLRLDAPLAVPSHDFH